MTLAVIGFSYRSIGGSTARKAFAGSFLPFFAIMDAKLLASAAFRSLLKAALRAYGLKTLFRLI
ncbi:hypothetical protein [Parvularcula sp. IMCC14364]|uniref:hypothetical protein n=1 Tax=Parvularcula sp. IMCC14364 TaxID=3067902 RepID=UPI0027421F77|nr:hypothetical protein [Parvularcula sp. IMCC14364]